MNTMTIGKKLTAGFAVLGLMMAFIGGFSLFEFSKMNRAAIGFTDSILPAVVRTSTLGETINACAAMSWMSSWWRTIPSKEPIIATRARRACRRSHAR